MVVLHARPNSAWNLEILLKFGHLILRQMFIFVATRCQILRLKCTKSNSHPAGRAYSAPQATGLLAGFKGPTSKQWEEKQWGTEECWRGGQERGRKGRKGERRGREWRGRDIGKGWGPPKCWFTRHVRNAEEYSGANCVVKAWLKAWLHGWQ